MTSLGIIQQKFKKKKGIFGRGEWAVGICPFHEEKTPSCFYSAKRDKFHCLGCGKAGSGAELAAAILSHKVVDKTTKTEDQMAKGTKKGSCGGTPKKDGSGGGNGNKGTPRQPK